MDLGIGIRYSGQGLRAIALEKDEDGISVTDIATGPSSGDIREFLTDHGFPIEDARVAVGLGPGEFLSAFMRRESGMDDGAMEDHLRWEMNRKMISDPSGYTMNFVLSGDVGFMFSARKEVIEGLLASRLPGMMVDVEPSALANGCEGADEVCEGTVMVISVEAEGISAMAMEDGLPIAVESFSARMEGWIERLPGLDFLGGEINDDEAADRFAKYASGSFSRLSSRIGSEWRPTRIVLAGGGVYTGDVAGMTAEKTGIETVVSDPFTSTRILIPTLGPRLKGLGSAFTVCFGLALRAIEG